MLSFSPCGELFRMGNLGPMLFWACYSCFKTQFSKKKNALKQTTATEQCLIHRLNHKPSSGPHLRRQCERCRRRWAAGWWGAKAVGRLDCGCTAPVTSDHSPCHGSVQRTRTGEGCWTPLLQRVVQEPKWGERKKKWVIHIKVKRQTLSYSNIPTSNWVWCVVVVNINSGV